MAQIKKHQQGGTVGLAAKPTEVKPATKKQLKFLVDGEEFLMDESEFNGIADKAFTNEVRKGQAKLRDKGKWMQEFQTKLAEAQNGVFDIQSSGNTVSNIKYTSNNPSYDGSSSDGLNSDGSVAQRTGLGRTIAPRVSGNSDQMGAILNNYIGENVIGSRQNSLAKEQSKLDADNQKAKDTYENSIKKDASTFMGASLGKLSFGADWDNDTARKLILDKVWGKETGHVASIDKAFQSYVKKAFDPYYDDKLEDYAKAGVDLKGIRSKLSSIYDPQTQSFTTPLKGIGDLFRYSDALDSIASDSPLFNKNAYKGLSPAGTPKTAEELAAEKAAADAALAKQNAENSEKAKRDAEAKRIADSKVNGIQSDGLMYAAGQLVSGKYAPTEVDFQGNKVINYYSPDSGYYVEGKKSDASGYQTFLNTIQQDPTKKAIYDAAVKRSSNLDTFYHRDNLNELMVNGFLDDSTESRNIRESGNYAFRNFGSSFKPNAAVNLTDMFTDSNGNKVNGNIFNIRSNNINHLGNQDIETVINTDDGKDFRGYLRRDANGKYKLYKRNADGSLVEQNDPSLNQLLASIANVKRGIAIKNQGNFGIRRSNYKYETPTEIVARTDRDRLNYIGGSTMPSIHKNGGNITKKQIGGIINKSNGTNNATVDNSNTKKGTSNYQATKVADVFNGSYKMGTQEKLEVTALLADLTGVGLALTGAGSIGAGVVGAVGTSAQLAADISRDGLDWGDAGRAALGYGLDAVSAIPGLGLGAKAFKTAKTIKTISKWLMPALAGIGAVRASALLGEVATGNKKLTDLSVEDFRTLTTGIHAATGGARLINNRVAVKRTNVNELALKNGSVNLDDSQVKALGKLSGADKETQAKLFAIDNLNKQGKNVSDVDLKTIKDGFKAKAQFWKGADATKNKEIVNITTSKNGFALKDLDNFQGNSLKDRYMRWAIDKAAIRNPQLSGNQYLDLPNASRAKQTGFFGDYMRKNSYTGSNVYGKSTQYGYNAPYDRTGPSSILGPKSDYGVTSPYVSTAPMTATGYNPNSNTAKETIDPTALIIGKTTAPQYPKIGVEFNSGKVTPARKGAATKKQNKANKGKGPGDQLAAFKSGGILKLQQGGAPYRLAPEITPTERMNTILNSFRGVQLQAPSKVNIPTIGSNLTGNIGLYKNANGNFVNDSNRVFKQPIISGNAMSQNRGIAVTGSNTGLFGKLKNLVGQVNTHDLSEFGRALATRAVNQRIDTRVEAPLMTAPQEVSVPISGNLLALSGANNRANDLVRTGGVGATSDGQLQAIQQLEYNKQANLVRAQGEAENANTIAQSRLMNLENISRNNAARSEVANRNISTLANSKQAERAAQNQKLGMVAQPLLSFWENRNAENLREEAQNKQIDNQIALSSLSGQVNDVKSPLMSRATDLYSKSIDSNLDAVTRKNYALQYEAVQKQLEGLNTASKTHALQLMKNNKYIVPEDYYSQWRTPVQAKGGVMNKNINAMNKANMSVYKERLKEINQEIKDNKKGNAETLKEVRKLVSQALKTK